MGLGQMDDVGNEEAEEKDEEECVDRQQQRGRSVWGGSYWGEGRRWMVGDMTFVSMVMVSPSPTRRASACVCMCVCFHVHVCV